MNLRDGAKVAGPLREAVLDWIATGRIRDAKTFIPLQDAAFHLFDRRPFDRPPSAATGDHP